MNGDSRIPGSAYWEPVRDNQGRLARWRPVLAILRWADPPDGRRGGPRNVLVQREDDGSLAVVPFPRHLRVRRNSTPPPVDTA